jgi:hypothetical protein
MLTEMPEAKNSTIRTRETMATVFIFTLIYFGSYRLKDIFFYILKNKELFFAQAFRYIHACWVSFVYVSCVSIGSVSAASADFSVLANSTFTL